MVVVKTIEEFKDKNEEELKAFMMYRTGIIDPDVIADTLQDFYTRIFIYKTLEKYDENRMWTEEGNIRNFERWICNNFCWLLPLLRKKNYTSVLRLRIAKGDKEVKDKKSYDAPQEKDDDFEIFRFYSTLRVREGQKETPADIYEVINPAVKESPYAIDSNFNFSMVEMQEDREACEDLNAFFRHVRRTMPYKKSFQIESYMKYRIKGLNSVDIAILLNVSNNMVKFIKQDALKVFKKWLKNRITV